MPPSRRQVLRTTGLSLAGIGGCATGSEPPASDAGRSTPTTAGQPSVTEPTERMPTHEPPASLRCGTGPLPEDGWPLPDRGGGRTNHAPAAAGPTERPTAAWSVTVPEPETGENDLTRPTVADGRVYVGRRIAVGPNQLPPDEQYVHAYDAATGERRWHATVSGRPSPPAVAGDVVLVHDDATLYALDAESGAERWTHDPPGGIHRVLPTPAGILVAPFRADPDREVRALDADGRVAWNVGLPGAVSSKFAWVDGRAYVATRDAVLVAIDSDEPAVAWTRDLQDDEDTVPASLVATPCAVFAAIDGDLYAVRRTGELEWSAPVGVRHLATDGETVYGVDGDGYVRAVAIADGTRRWEGFFGVEDWRYTDGFYDEPAVDGETLYAGTLDRNLLAVATDDGRGRWTRELGWGRPAQVAVVGETLYAAGGRHLVAFR